VTKLKQYLRGFDTKYGRGWRGKNKYGVERRRGQEILSNF
jgi:hypothetical protein